MQQRQLDYFNYPVKLIAEFEKQVTPFFGRIKANDLQIRTLENLRDLLLPKLMSGEVKVLL